MLDHQQHIVGEVVRLRRGGTLVEHKLSLHNNCPVSKQLRHGWWEESLLNDTLRHLSHDSVILDCGAHIGNHSMFWSPHVAKIHAFEASPKSASALLYNVTNNNYNNIEIHNVCLWDRDNVQLELVPDNTNMGHIHCKPGIGSMSRCLDSYGFDRVDFIKLDVEGAELEVLDGARSILAKFKPYLLIEVHSWMSKIGHEHREKLAKFLDNFGYRWCINCTIHGS